MTITVRRDGSPVEGIAVGLNGVVVGRTDQFGQTTAVVPYLAEMQIAAERAANRSASGEAASPALTSGAPARGIVTKNVSVPTNVSVVPLREPRPGRTVRFLAHVDGAPVAEGRVRRGGSKVGQTGANGRFSITVPWNESTTVAVTRGEASGERTLQLPPLSVSVRNAGLGVLAAGQSATVRVRQDGRPVSHATVEVADQTVRTDADGTARITLPMQQRATVSVERGEMQSVTTIRGLFLPYLAALGVVVAAVSGLVVLVVFRGRIGAAATAGYGYAVWVGRHIIVGLIRVADGLVALGVRVRHTLAEVATALRRRDLREALSFAIARVRDAVAVLCDRLRSVSLRGGEATRETVGEDGADTAESTRRTSTPPTAIRRAFEALLRRVPGRTATLTPTEIGRRAVDRGLPADAVWTITDTFRAVTYGGRDPDALADEVREAVERIRADDARAEEDDA
ncbi:MAG: DUF4129 domain-containing protein [Haloquadratum sp.]